MKDPQTPRGKIGPEGGRDIHVKKEKRREGKRERERGALGKSLQLAHLIDYALIHRAVLLNTMALDGTTARLIDGAVVKDCACVNKCVRL